MIDLTTGKIELNGIVIEPKTTLDDLRKYGAEKVDVLERGKGRGIVRIKELVHCNGINARVVIELNERLNSRRVIIMPSLSGLGTMKLLDASKLWLKGIVIGEYIEDKNLISGTYGWGYISAQYRDDIDYGVIGGEIMIDYDE